MFGCGETTCQDDDKPPPPPPCETFESCDTCINDYCSWAVGVGCLESCDMIADVICYGPEDTPPPGSVDVCSAADLTVSNKELCASKMDCTSCVGTTITPTFNNEVSESTCQWRDDGTCIAECDRGGCGETVCPVDTTKIPCESYESCDTCLNDECSWAPFVGCLESCDVIADTPCYEVAEMDNGPTDMPPPGPADVCAAAEIVVANEELCGSQTDCSSCVSTVLLVPSFMDQEPSSTCEWRELDSTCITGCNMGGCGSDTCPDTSTSTVVETSKPDEVSTPNGNNCHTFGTCEDCVTGSCAWVPSEGCIEECSMIADTSCFEGQDACPVVESEDPAVDSASLEIEFEASDESTAARGIMTFTLEFVGAFAATVLALIL